MIMQPIIAWIFMVKGYPLLLFIGVVWSGTVSGMGVDVSGVGVEVSGMGDEVSGGVVER